MEIQKYSLLLKDMWNHILCLVKGIYTLNNSQDLTLNNIFSKRNYAAMVPLRRKSIGSLLVHNISYFRHFFRLEYTFDSAGFIRASFLGS